MSTGNSPTSPAVLYHQALRSFRRQAFRNLAARMMVADSPHLDFMLSAAQNHAVLYATSESTSQHENSQENHNVQQGGGISQHQAPGQYTLPQSDTPSAQPHAYPLRVSTPNRPSPSTVISAPYPVKKRALGKAHFAADYYKHEIQEAAQADESVERYMGCFHKDNIEQNIPGPYDASETFYSLYHPPTTSHVLLQDAYLQQAGAGQGGFGLHTPSPQPSAFGGPPFSFYHPAQYTS